MGTSRTASHCAACLCFQGPEQRRSDGHVAVRFGDYKKYRVWLDGDEVTDQAFEAEAGDPGWVILYDLDEQGRKFLCPASQQHGRQSLLHGRVEVVAV